MADLLIKGMEMPECCYGCPLVYDMGEGNYACPFSYGYAPIDGRRDDCPLVEVELQGYDNYWESEIWTEVKHGLAD